MSKIKIYWFCQIVGWSFFGFANILIFHFESNELQSFDILVEVFQILFYIGSTHLLRHLIKKGDWVTIPPLKLIPMALLADLVLGLSNYLFLLLIFFVSGSLLLSLELKTQLVVIGIGGPTLMYFLWTLIYFTFHYFQQYRQSLKYEALITETELNQLKSQLNPHFIFNALNGIRALVDENPVKSKSAITRLSNILRNSLLLDKKKLISLEEELDIVKDYLELESIRYEERLRIVYDIDPKTLSIQVPPMMVQTLVENGIKHGIANLKEGGELKVSSEKIQEKLSIFIRNSGQYEVNSKKEVGYGLLNTQKRLEILYGPEASLKIENENKETVLTEIQIPSRSLMQTEI
jgi:two-component system LytT family sensor kinase